jgi:hypothetical protein
MTIKDWTSYERRKPWLRKAPYTEIVPVLTLSHMAHLEASETREGEESSSLIKPRLHASSSTVEMFSDGGKKKMIVTINSLIEFQQKKLF